MIKDAHDALVDIQSSGRSKELLAQVRIQLLIGSCSPPLVDIQSSGRSHSKPTSCPACCEVRTLTFELLSAIAERRTNL